MKKIMAMLALALIFQASSVIADSSNQFMVSGVLRSNTDGIVIKLVQGVKPASSANEAVGAFTRDILTQYPGYSLMDAIASPLPKQVQKCQSSNAI